MYEKDVMIKKNDKGESVLVKTEEIVLDREYINRQLSQIRLDKIGIERQVKTLQVKYKELREFESLYKKELKKFESTEDDLFSLE